ncbi:MAG: RNA polymerase sigma-70 factor [Marinilabiliaceae bacterium]|nr:RNA polymerase sigma-70 factor [Marinilabiliaceae bacterium]
MDNAGEIDKEIIKGLIKEDAKAFEDLYKMYGRRLYVFAFDYLKSKDDAEEVVQEVFVKIWEKRFQLKQQESIRGYIFTIAYNAIRKAFVKKGREEKNIQLFTQSLLNDSDDSQSEINYSEMMLKIDQIVDQMPDRRREVFNLSKKEGLTNSEIATYLNLSEKTVKNQITLAFQTIREQLKNSLPVILFISMFY